MRGAFDSLVVALRQMTSPQATPAHQRVGFTIAFVALAAKMAKADGCVTPVEVETFRCLYEVAPHEAANVQRVFALASRDTAGFETYARQIYRALAREPRRVRDVFDGLFQIAAADGILHAGEERFLKTVAGIFDISPDEYRSIRVAFIDADEAELQRPFDPYEVLGVDRAISAEALKRRHRELVREHHPDALIARGIPMAFHAAASRKLAIFNAAYDEIKVRRSALEGRDLKLDR